MPRAHGDSRGFTLTELLVVVAIIVLLTSLVVPNIAGRLTRARMNASEDQIAEIEAALAAYHADFGTYPGDVFPTEDINNNGKLDTGEDIGVDINGDGVADYACQNDGSPLSPPNGRLDRGDGVVNIFDLEWALKTTAKSGPYLKEIPLDPWGSRYVYYAPMRRPEGTNAASDFLWIDPGEVGDLITSEDTDEDGRLDTTPTDEDDGIADFDTTNTSQVRTTATPPLVSFINMKAGAGNGILDFGDDDNKDGVVQRYNITTGSPVALEYGNQDISPDGLARNLGYYIYSIGRNKKDETATGYEDINLNYQLDNSIATDDDPTYDEDLDATADNSLDTGYEDTGLDGIPGTKDQGEDDGELTVGTETPTPRDETFNGPYNTTGLDKGGDDINSWNNKRPWRDHASYGG
jgi:prepilin-type N-terminal cleavage/methylation domain-containing protein